MKIIPLKKCPQCGEFWGLTGAQALLQECFKCGYQADESTDDDDDDQNVPNDDWDEFED